MTAVSRLPVLVLLLAATAGQAASLPDYETFRTTQARSDAQLFDRHGVLLQELRVNSRVRRLEWVELADVSPALVKAVIQAEDRKFFDHSGVDWTALGAASVRALWQDNARGASTLSMQLVGWIDPQLRPDGSRRSLGQKWRQIRKAREIEDAWQKQEILETYLNMVYFRGELQGVAAAARGMFDKQPSGLNQAEALLLASLLRAPNAAPALVANRACLLGVSLGWKPSCVSLQDLARTSLVAPFRVRPEASDAPHVARALLRDGRLRAVSTLDAALQRFAQGALTHQLESLSGERVRDGALLVVDNRSGEVLAYVGNSGKGYVDGVTAPRQAGSTLKPFLYQLAIERRLLTAASILNDTQVNLATPTGLYVPQDYDREFKGPVSLRTALGSSLNVPAVRTLVLVGADPFVSRLRNLGFSELTEGGDYYGFSLALGSAEVTLWQQANAYRTLANGGAYSPLTLVQGKTGPRRQVMDRDASFIVSDMLADRSARFLTFGLESVLATPFWSAVKTGTSKDMRDNWCIGYSDRYTVGVWVGNFSGSPMQDVSGITGAAPVWLEVMRYLHQGRPVRPPRPGNGIVSTDVQYVPAVEAARREYFLRSTESTVVRLPERAEPRIAQFIYPARGTILAIDPDIPDGHQRVFFEISAEQTHFRIRVDNGELVALEAGWEPVPGRHRVSLIDDDGAVLDHADFEVRGAALR